MANLWIYNETDEKWEKVTKEDGLPVTGELTLDTDGIDIGEVVVKGKTAGNVETPILTDADGTLHTTFGALDGTVDSVKVYSAGSIGHGIKNVTTAGTDVALAASTACKYVIVQAREGNTSKIAVGGTGVDATATTGTGILLAVEDSVYLDVDNLADVFIDSRVSGEGVVFTYGVD